MTPCQTPFHPLIQPKDMLSGAQKYLLRLLYGWAGRTILHRGRLVEVLEAHDSTRNVLPLMESDLSESLTPSFEHSGLTFWIPRRDSDRKRLNLERRDKSRRHLSIGVCWGDSRPKGARSQRLRSNFPSAEYLRRLVADMGYDSDAALAAFAPPLKFQGRPDRRKKIAVGGADTQAERKTNRDYQCIDYGLNLYVPQASTRRTLTGGGFTEEQVRQGLSKMKTDDTMKTALFEVVYRRRSSQVVAAEFGFCRAKLDVYASRLRGHIRKTQPTLARATSRVDVPDLHGEENLASYLQ